MTNADLMTNRQFLASLSSVAAARPGHPATRSKPPRAGVTKRGGGSRTCVARQQVIGDGLRCSSPGVHTVRAKPNYRQHLPVAFGAKATSKNADSN